MSINDHDLKMKILVIIPAYNEAGRILTTVRELRETAKDLDLIVINDASTDDTEKILDQNGIPHITHTANQGIGGAVQTGYRYALANGYDAAVQLDGDGQHDPAELPLLIHALSETGADLVIGSRFLEKKGFQSTAARRFGIRFFTFWIRLLTGRTVTDPTSGFRIAGERAVRFFSRHYAQDYPEPESIVELLKAGGKVEEVPVYMRERKEGVSSISPRKAVYYMFKVSAACLLRAVRSGAAIE